MLFGFSMLALIQHTWLLKVVPQLWMEDGKMISDHSIIGVATALLEEHVPRAKTSTVRSNSVGHLGLNSYRKGMICGLKAARIWISYVRELVGVTPFLWH